MLAASSTASGQRVQGSPPIASTLHSYVPARKNQVYTPSVPIQLSTTATCLFVAAIPGTVEAYLQYARALHKTALDTLNRQRAHVTNQAAAVLQLRNLLKAIQSLIPLQLSPTPPRQTSSSGRSGLLKAQNVENQDSKRCKIASPPLRPNMRMSSRCWRRGWPGWTNAKRRCGVAWSHCGMPARSLGLLERHWKTRHWPRANRRLTSLITP